MTHEVWKWIGVSKTKPNEASQILEEILDKFIDSIHTFLGISPFVYPTVEKMIEVGLKTESEFRYFWVWLNEYGLEKLKKIASISLPDSDETLDYLDYQLYLLTADIENGILESVVATWADMITELHEHIIVFGEIATTRTEACNVNIPHLSAEYRGSEPWMAEAGVYGAWYIESQIFDPLMGWNGIVKNPAEVQQGFL